MWRPRPARVCPRWARRDSAKTLSLDLKNVALSSAVPAPAPAPDGTAAVQPDAAPQARMSPLLLDMDDYLGS